MVGPVADVSLPVGGVSGRGVGGGARRSRLGVVGEAAELVTTVRVRHGTGAQCPTRHVQHVPLFLTTRTVARARAGPNRVSQNRSQPGFGKPTRSFRFRKPAPDPLVRSLATTPPPPPRLPERDAIDTRYLNRGTPCLSLSFTCTVVARSGATRHLGDTVSCGDDSCGACRFCCRGTPGPGPPPTEATSTTQEQVLSHEAIRSRPAGRNLANIRGVRTDGKMTIVAYTPFPSPQTRGWSAVRNWSVHSNSIPSSPPRGLCWRSPRPRNANSQTAGCQDEPSRDKPIGAGQPIGTHGCSTASASGPPSHPAGPGRRTGLPLGVSTGRRSSTHRRAGSCWCCTRNTRPRRPPLRRLSNGSAGNCRTCRGAPLPTFLRQAARTQP